MRNIQRIVLILAAAFAAGILFVNVYTSVVDAPNWGRDIPASIEAARAYFKTANPGSFFRIASPINQLLALTAFIVCWRAGRLARVLCGLALLTAVGVDVMTFAYFYPRNEIMFVAPINDLDAIRSAWSGWTSMNWVRSAVGAVGVACDFTALVLVASGSRADFESSS